MARPKVWLGIREYARHRGVSQTAVQKAIKQGRITPRKKDGKIHAPTADADWAKNTTPVEAPAPVSAPSPAEPAEAAAAPDDEDGPPDLDGDLTFAEARTAKEAYQARLKKLEFEEKSGKLVDRELVRKGQFVILRTVRDRMLDIPDRMADELAAATDPSTVHELLRGEIRAALAATSEALAALEAEEAA